MALVAAVGPAPAADPPTADALALRLLDGEGLYTVAGGLKPVSDGFWQARFPAADATSPEVEAARAALASLPLGPDLEAGVLVFAAPFDGKRSASAFVVHKPALRALVERRGDVFGPLGVTAATPPGAVMGAIDRAPRSTRWRAFGLAFGYPEYAVESFVGAGEKQVDTKTFVERDFLQLPTFASDEGRFVYAVPKGHAERDEDRVLRAATADVFARYRAWRCVYLDQHDLGAVELLRNWITPPVVVCSAPVVAYLPGVVAPSPASRCEAPRRFPRHRR